MPKSAQRDADVVFLRLDFSVHHAVLIVVAIIGAAE